ncbi:MAG: arsenate reductase [Frankiales bacterium]|nr:arsenate reductase [Frankiales bacterium]
MTQNGPVKLVVWTNNACSKSRGAVQLLEERGVEFERRFYLDDPPTREELAEVMAKLDDPTAIARPGVTGDLLGQLSADPSLIERPVAILGDRAVVARPPERVLDLL